MQLNKNKTCQKGIALITTIILTSIMLSSVLVITKEMVDEVQNSIRLDNSLIAYYAAEAGLEDALLEFRYDHEAEISENNDNNPALDVTKDANNTPRTVNITTDTRIPNSTAKDFTKSYYELVMWNKSSQILNQKILKDDTAEFVVPNMTQPVVLDWEGNPNTDFSKNDYKVEITVYDEKGNIIPPEGIFDSLGRTRGKQFTEIGKTGAIIPTSVGGDKKIIRIKPAYVAINRPNSPDPNGAYTEGDPLPNNEVPSIDLTINKTPTSDLIAGATTNIESVGYYGGVARKITATIDRTSGNILSIFDYVIYSGSDLIK